MVVSFSALLARAICAALQELEAGPTPRTRQPAVYESKKFNVSGGRRRLFEEAVLRNMLFRVLTYWAIDAEVVESERTTEVGTFLDLLVTYADGAVRRTIAIELVCYEEWTSVTDRSVKSHVTRGEAYRDALGADKCFVVNFDCSDRNDAPAGTGDACSARTCLWDVRHDPSSYEVSSIEVFDTTTKTFQPLVGDGVPARPAP